MSRKKAEILNKLRELSRQAPVIIPGLVKSVDEGSGTCTIEIDELEFKARLNAAENGEKGFTIIPTVGSWVIAGRLDESGDTWTVLVFTGVDKIIMRSGNNGGLVIGSDLVDQLNAIEQDLNTLKQVFTTWTPVTQDGGAALKAAAATWSAQQITQTTINDIEDSQITH